MFDDHFTVESPGILPGLVRVSNIREFHFSRNPMIVELLNEYDLVKEFGEGVDRVFRDMAEAGLPEPEYRQSEFMLYATLKNKNWGKEDASWDVDQYVSGTRPEKRPEKRPDGETRIAERANQVLEVLIDNPSISRPAICEKLGLSDRQVRTAIDYLKKNKKIHREGPAKGGKWILD